MEPGPGPYTQLLLRLQAGDSEAETELYHALYGELRRTAGRLMAQERKNHTLTPTALVHDAYLRMREIDPQAFRDHRHFLQIAAKVMRQLLVDHARAYQAAKRTGGQVRVELDDNLIGSTKDADLILGVHESLERLRDERPECYQVVELRYFAGFTLEEVGLILGVSVRTAKRHWTIARTLLRGQLDVAASSTAS